MAEEAPNDLVDKLVRVQRLRRIIVIVALVLLVVSLLNPLTSIAYARSALWALCGCMCIVEVSLLKRVRESGATLDPGIRAPTYVNAVLYFAVALLPLLRGR